MTTRRRRATGAIAVAAAVFVLAALFLNSGPVRRYLVGVTGEESVLEGLKGVGALAVLDWRGPDLDLAPTAVQSDLGMNPYGVNTFLQLEADPENVRRSLAAVKDAGIGWARQQFPWEDIEIHGRGDFVDRRNEPPRSAWDKYDRIVDTAREHNVQLLVRLDNPPDWAFADPAAAGEKGPPDNLDDFGNFVAAVVERYCGKVRYYQIWNEPNIYPEWGERDVDPAAYARLLKVAAARARQACPDVRIVSAALAQTTEPGGRNMDDLAYLEALYRAGWGPDFDVLAAQAFGLWTGPTDYRASRDRTNFSRPMLARDIMVRSGDGAKPIWITEMGWDSPPANLDAPYGRIDEQGRARYTVAAYERMARDWPWAGVGFLWFLRRPDFDWHQRPEGYFRLLEPDWVELPAYGALRDRAARRPIVLRRGAHGPDDWGLAFDGPWRSEPLDGPPAARVGSRDAELQFTFDGTAFEVGLAPAPGGQVPQLYLVVDDAVREAMPEPAGAGHRLRVDELAVGEHHVKLRVDVGELWLERLLVEGPGPASPLRPLYAALIAAALAAFAAASAAVWFRRRRSRCHARAGGQASAE